MKKWIYKPRDDADADAPETVLLGSTFNQAQVLGPDKHHNAEMIAALPAMADACREAMHNPASPPSVLKAAADALVVAGLHKYPIDKGISGRWWRAVDTVTVKSCAYFVTRVDARSAHEWEVSVRLRSEGQDGTPSDAMPVSLNVTDQELQAIARRLGNEIVDLPLKPLVS